MPTKREKSQQIILDGLDQEAVILIGLTSSELSMVFGGSFLLYVIICCLVLGLFGLPIGLGIGFVQGWVLGKKIGRMKQGRPSYLLIGELSRKWQLHGLSIFGLFKIKIPSGFINDAVWDFQSHICGNEPKLIRKHNPNEDED